MAPSETCRRSRGSDLSRRCQKPERWSTQEMKDGTFYISDDDRVNYGSIARAPAMEATKPVAGGRTVKPILRRTHQPVREAHTPSR